MARSKAAIRQKHPAIQYIDDVLSGNILVCKWVRLAVQRHIDDLSRWQGKKGAPYYFDEDAAQHVIDFFSFLRHSKGKWAGQTFQLEPWQQFILWVVFGWKRSIDDCRRFRTVYIEIARKNGKSTYGAGSGLYMFFADGEQGAECFTAAPLDINTIVPTVNGWTTMGEIRKGDIVFDVNGEPTVVAGVSPIFKNRRCYRVIFDDGTSVVTDGEHLWTVNSRFFGKSLAGINPKISPTLNRVISTKEILDSVRTPRGAANHRINAAHPLQLKHSDDLPIGPYSLGVWLGDGRSNRGSIVHHPDDREILEWIQAEGYAVREHGLNGKDGLLHYTVLGIRGKLSLLGLLDNKHIPTKYLRSSKEQRIELLRGLLDTDGTCTKTGEIRFTNRNERLARGVYHLMASVGLIPKIHHVMVNCRPHWVVSVRGNGEPLFHLQRKAKRQVLPTLRARARRIIRVEQAESVPVRCISVDSPSNLFLITEALIPTHNTKKEQAAIVHSEATRMVRSSPSLNKRIGIFKNNLHIPDTASKFVPLGADSKTEDGLNVHFALIDEYHAHPNAGMYDVLRSGMGARTQPMMWIITTAGFEKYCACYDERSYLTSILEKIFNDESYFGIIFTIDDDDKWDDEKVWIKANPNLGLSVNLEDMRDMCRKAQRSPSKQNEFKTKKLNIWTETLTRWIAEEAWALCNFPVNIDALKGRKAYGAFDLSTTTDLTAWVLCFPPIVPGGKYQFLFNFYCPQEDLDLRFPNKNMLAVIRRWIEEGYIVSTPGNVIDYDFVEQQIRRDAQLFDIQEIPFDPYNATQLVNNLMKEGFEDKMVKFSQGIMNMSGPAKNFETKVLKQELAHGNNPVMNWMVACTEVYRDANANIKPVKPDRAKSEKRIDGVIAAIMALDRAVKGDSGESIYEHREPMMV